MTPSHMISIASKAVRPFATRVGSWAAAPGSSLPWRFTRRPPMHLGDWFRLKAPPHFLLPLHSRTPWQPLAGGGAFAGLQGGMGADTCCSTLPCASSSQLSTNLAVMPRRSGAGPELPDRPRHDGGEAAALARGHQVRRAAQGAACCLLIDSWLHSLPHICWVGRPDGGEAAALTRRHHSRRDAQGALSSIGDVAEPLAGNLACSIVL